MVFVAKLSGGQRLKLHVVLGIRRGHDHGLRTRRLKQHPLERRQPRRIHVLDHFHNRCSVISGQALVAVHERSVNQLQSLFLLGRHALQPQTLSRYFQAAVRNIHSDDFRECSSRRATRAAVFLHRTRGPAPAALPPNAALRPRPASAAARAGSVPRFLSLPPPALPASHPDPDCPLPPAAPVPRAPGGAAAADTASRSLLYADALPAIPRPSAKAFRLHLSRPSSASRRRAPGSRRTGGAADRCNTTSPSSVTV